MVFPVFSDKGDKPKLLLEKTCSLLDVKGLASDWPGLWRNNLLGGVVLGLSKYIESQSEGERILPFGVNGEWSLQIPEPLCFITYLLSNELLGDIGI